MGEPASFDPIAGKLNAEGPLQLGHAARLQTDGLRGEQTAAATADTAACHAAPTSG